MYELTFNRDTMKDLITYGYSQGRGRQLYGAIVCPYSGVFSHKTGGSTVTIPKIVCPYQVDDIIAIQEQWARSGNSFVYKINPESSSGGHGFYPYWSVPDTQGYEFSPANTMPLSATRLYARITSVRTWSLTPEVYYNYVNPHISTVDCAGVAKVIGYYDNGNRLLSKIRKRHNSSLLQRSSQPRTSSNLPLVPVTLPYYLKEPTYTVYSRKFQEFPNISPRNITLPASDFAQAYDPRENQEVPTWSHVYNPTNISTRQFQQLSSLDPGQRAWYCTMSGDPDLEIKQPTLYEYIGEAMYPPETDPFEPTAVWTRPAWGSTYWYYVLDGSSDIAVTPSGGTTRYYGKRIPVIASYNYNIIDPERYIFVWMISAYLSDSEGNIYGGLF